MIAGLLGIATAAKRRAVRDAAASPMRLHTSA
jgi:hypothetical protein